MPLRILLTAFLFLPLRSFAQTYKELDRQLTELFKQGKFADAIPVGERAVEEARKTVGENHVDFVNSIDHLAVIYSRNGLFEKAEPLNLQAVDILKRITGDTSERYINSLNYLAELYQKMGKYDYAEQFFKKALEIRKLKLGEDNPDYVYYFSSLANFYTDIGQYEKAEQLYLRQKELMGKAWGADDPDYARSLNSLGYLYFMMGLYDRAEPLFLETMQIRKKVLGDSTMDYAQSLNNLGTLYSTMGQLKKAEPLILEAIRIVEKLLGKDHPESVRFLNSLAIIYQRQEQYNQAETLYTRSRNIKKTEVGDKHYEYGICTNNLASLYNDMHEYRKAEALYLEANRIWESLYGKNHPAVATSLNNLATVYFGMKEYKKAFRYMEEATAIREKILGEFHPDFANALENLMNFHLDLREYDKAAPYLVRNGAIIVHNLRNLFTVLSENEKWDQITHTKSITESGSSYLYNYPAAGTDVRRAVFEVELFFKSLALADTRNMLDAVLHSRDTVVQKLFHEWQNNKTLIAKQYSLPVKNRLRGLDSISSVTEIMEKELNRRSASFRDQEMALNISMKEIQAKLDTGEKAVEFVRFLYFNTDWTDSTFYGAYVFGKQDSVPAFVPLFEEKQLQDLLARAGKTPTQRVSALYRGGKVTTGATSLFFGKDLYRLLWSPIEPYLKDARRVSYSPAGQLFSIAFPALPVDSNHLLMDKYTLRQYTSTRQIYLRNDAPVLPQDIVLFGNADFTMDSARLKNVRNKKTEGKSLTGSLYAPYTRGSTSGTWPELPGTATEIKQIGDLCAGRGLTARLQVREEASEENLKSLSGQSPQVLHIATHGFFLNRADSLEIKKGAGQSLRFSDDPLFRNGLILAGGNYAWSGKTPIEGVEDGIVTAYEISQLNLSNTELVVLSACETALGDIRGTEGVFGLQRAFKMAGVKKMIVSLWQVPDKETAELMTTFYSNWLKGQSIEDAFGRAQAEMRKKYPPFYWAAFVLVE